MPQDNVHDPFQAREASPSAEKKNKKLVRRSDLIDLVLEPLSAQIDQARLEILGRIQEVNESASIIAGQMRRQMDE